MYVLHYAPDNASMIVRLALEELGVPYRTRLVDRAARAQEAAAYRALAPTGLIPALETGSETLFETGAILLWLADRHGGLGPAPDDRDRGAFLSWLFFVSNTLHADARLEFYAERHAGADLAGFRAGTKARLERHLDLIEDLLAARPSWCRPEAPGALGLYIAAVVRWLGIYPADAPLSPDPAARPALAAMLAAVEARPAAARVAAAEGLGTRPFTDPVPPCPPEGSAT